MDSQEDLAVHGADEKAPEEQTTGVAGGDTRFQLLARVHATAKGYGLVLKADLGDDPAALTAPTWVPTYAGADWHEREAWEMFGIVFEGHPGLRHLYLPGEFEGHPLRKDFPLLSRRVKPWPGIVDVEPMPGEDEPADDPAADADGGEA
ncbi:MAG TPA: NADH-quinone oxidoreductase subunit C, partial [Actinomycetota bacterium]|nr:NADH-quinone oxidoreductase subunit C [Actinomycetota bacterium]